jgi:TolB-like protein/Tfp pilus assembly protein PilF
MPNKKNPFFQELKKRNVYRVATVYAIAGWLIIQVADVIFPYFGLPDWMVTAIIIVTLLGFPIAVILAWIFEMSPDGIIRTGSRKASGNPYTDRRKKPLTSTITIVALLVLVAGQFIYFSFVRKPAHEIQAAASITLSMPSNSIAVLPFVNLSEEKDNQYFSDGVMEAILNNLSMIRDLKVVSRTSVEKYRNQEKSMREIASELEVANILEGSVQRIGEQVRVTVQLISAEMDEHIWADSYDRQLTDIFAIQSEIAETIAANLEVALSTEELELIKNAPTSNLKAYEMYLKAYSVDYNSEQMILDGLDVGREIIQLDPEFGLAYAFNAGLLYQLSFYGYPKSLCEDSALHLLDLASEKDPKEWLPYMYSGVLLFRNFSEEEGEKNIQKSIDLNPNNSWGYDFLGKYYLRSQEYEKGIDYILKGATRSAGETDPKNNDEQLGYFLISFDRDQAYAHFKKAHESDPENAAVLQQLSNLSLYNRDFNSALEYAEQFVSLRPDLLNGKNMVAQAHLFLGHYEQAEKKYREMLDASSDYTNEYMIYAFKQRLGYATMMNGREKEGRALLESYRDTLLAAVQRNEIMSSGFGDYYDLALIYAVLGQKEEAMEWLRLAKANEIHGAFFRMDFLVSDPMLNNLRDDPEFQRMLDEKREQEKMIHQLFYTKIREYHDRDELKWLKIPKS